MKQIIETNGKKILQILGYGASKRISERIKTRYGVDKDRGLIWKILSGKVPDGFKPSDQLYEYIGEASFELIEEINKTSTLFLKEVKRKAA